MVQLRVLSVCPPYVLVGRLLVHYEEGAQPGPVRGVGGLLIPSVASPSSIPALKALHAALREGPPDEWVRQRREVRPAVVSWPRLRSSSRRGHLRWIQLYSDRQQRRTFLCDEVPLLARRQRTPPRQMLYKLGISSLILIARASVRVSSRRSWWPRAIAMVLASVFNGR